MPSRPNRSARLARVACCLAGCAAVTPAPSAPAAPPTSVSRTEPIACSLDEREVEFAQALTLFHALPPPGAQVERPFAELLRAARARVTVLPGDASDAPARVSVDTSMVHLDGVARAAQLALFPARASNFAGLVTPLARHRLHLVDAAPGSLRLALSRIPRVSLRAPPEARGCDDVRLRPVADFAAPAPPPLRPIRLPPGRWNLHPSPAPDASPSAALDLLQGDAVSLLELRADRWARVRWTSGDAVLVGWVDLVHHVLPQIGHGAGTSSRARPPGRCAQSTGCTDEPPLLVDDRGVTRVVGRLLRGARVRLGATSGGRTAVVVCDPDVDWADGVGVFIPSEGAGGCGAP
ncbi:MAG: hypothetical protein R3A48_17495 [Polyangiales bacterium]